VDVAVASLHSQIPTACNRLFHAALSARRGFTEFLKISKEADSKRPEAITFMFSRMGRGLSLLGHLQQKKFSPLFKRHKNGIEC
jgi:hypothetical protein